VKIVYVFPEESHPKIIYATGLLRPGGAKIFDYLSDPQSMKIATDFGFIQIKP